MLDQALVKLTEFRGVFANHEETIIPPNHFKDALNLEFGPGFFASRKGITSHLTLSDVRRIWTYQIPGQNNRELILNGSGQIFDSTNLATPILTIATMTDFSAVSMFGRAYITPHDGQTGLANEFVYVYSGSGTARKAAGLPPQGFDLTLTVVSQTASGDDIVAPVAPANGVQVLTTSPYIPNIPTKIKFFQTGGTVTAITIAVAGFGPSHVTQNKTYVNKIASAGPTTYTTGEIWEEITSITISGLTGSGGSFKVETFGSNIGKAEIGYHIIGLVYETVSGFLTKPGPENNLSAINVTQKYKAIKVDGIPAAPGSEISKVKVVASKFIKKKNYSGNADPQQYEMFFVPESAGGSLAVGRTSTVVNFFDADLLDSADYLLDNLSEIPAGVAIFGTSKGRMLIGGESANQAILRGSKGGEPEAISATDGFVIADPVSGNIKNIAEYRDCIHLFKSHATVITQDDNVNLSEWTINVIDRSKGAEPHSIATVLGRETDVEDTLIVAGRGGVQAFNGAYQEFPLSWKIKEVWDRVSAEFFYKTQISIDPINKIILLCFAAFDSGGVVDECWAAYYEDGLNYQDIKWIPWEFTHAAGTFVPETITSGIDSIAANPTASFKLGYRSATKVYKYQHNVTVDNDDSLSFSAMWETYKYTPEDDGSIIQLTGMRINITGFGEATLSLLGPNDSPIETPASFQIPGSSNGNILQKLNFVDDRVSIKGQVSGLNKSILVSAIWLFGRGIWLEKPSGLEFDLKENLISYWDLEAASGTRVDSHGTNNLTDNNTVTSNPGRVGNAAQFTEANSEFLSIPTNSTLQLGNIDFTIALWVYLDSLPVGDNHTFLAGAGQDYFFEMSVAFGSVYISYLDAAAVSKKIEVPGGFTPFTLGTWHFLAGWFDAATQTLSIQHNDNAVTSAVQSTPPRTPTAVGDWVMGQRNSLNFHNGRLDEVGIWKRVLTAHEREFLYNRGAGRNYASLTV